MTKLRLSAAFLAVALAGCAQTSTSRSASQGLAPSITSTTAAALPAHVGPAPAHSRLGGGKIQHVVIIFQENRTTDNLFNGLPGADTVKSGENTADVQITLQPVLLTAPWDLDHSHPAFETAYNGGAMNGFSLELSTCRAARRDCSTKYLRAYGYVPQKEVQPYFTMAEQYAFGDEMFSTQEGPSFPAHQYILSGTSTIATGSSLRAAENPYTSDQGFTGGCDAPVGSLVMLIDSNGTEDQLTYPCFDRPALSDLADAKGLTWHYYQAGPGAGLWNGPDAIKHIRYGSQFSTDVVWPPSKVLTDIKNGALSNVVWVTPTELASDHAGITNGSGPDWVASVVNAIGESKYWDSTTIVVTWDDWGGWYDHVSPPQYNSYELGMRVPLIVISPYAKQGYVSHVQHEFGSILKFTEKAFGLGSLGTTDVRADDLSDCFQFSQSPHSFTPIKTTRDAEYFLRQPLDPRSPDTDF